MEKFLQIAVVVGTLGISGFSLGAEDYNQGLKKELSEVKKIQVEKVAPAISSAESINTVTQVQTQTPPSTNTNLQPIYILQQPAASPQAQVQPATTIEAAPVKESRADQLRKQREEVEHQTENKLVERLEDDRLLSEKDRADRLLAPLNPPTPAVSPSPLTVNPPITTVPTNATVTPATVVPPPVVAPVIVTREEVPTVTATHDDLMRNNESEEPAKFSIGALAGLGSYPSVGNVNGAYAAGVLMDMQFAERLGLETAFLYSSYDIKNNYNNFYCPGCGGSLVTTLNQYNFDVGLTYHILGGRVSPVVGVIADYTRRSYSDRIRYGSNTGSTRGSNSFDGGFLVGVDVSATKKLTVGMDIRYLMNFSYRTDDALAYNVGYQQGDPIESLNYYFATLSLKLSL